MADLSHKLYCLTNLLFFSFSITILLCYYINLSLLVFRCLFSVDIYLSFGISLSNPIFSVSLSTVPEVFCGEVLEISVALLAISLPIKSLVTSPVFGLLFLKQF